MMERDIKACFFDIDGTLIDHEGGSVMPQSTKESLCALREKGVKLFVATVRPSAPPHGPQPGGYPAAGGDCEKGKISLPDH